MYQCSTGLFVMQCFIAWFDGWHKQQLNLWLIARNIIIVNYLSKLNHLSSCLYSLHNTDKTTFICILFISKMKKALRETKTLRAGCSKAEPKNFAPPQTPFSGAQDGQNLISCKRSVAYLHPQTQFGEDRCTQFREQRGIGRPKLAQR